MGKICAPSSSREPSARVSRRALRRLPTVGAGNRLGGDLRTPRSADTSPSSYVDYLRRIADDVRERFTAPSVSEARVAGSARNRMVVAASGRHARDQGPTVGRPAVSFSSKFLPARKARRAKSSQRTLLFENA
jgi:hypothetical protein